MRILNQKTGQQRFVPDGTKVELADGEIALYAGQREEKESRRLRLRASFLKGKFIEAAIKLSGRTISQVAEALGVRPCAACQMRALVAQKVEELGHERALSLLKASFSLDDEQIKAVMKEIESGSTSTGTTTKPANH